MNVSNINYGSFKTMEERIADVNRDILSKCNKELEFIYECNYSDLIHGGLEYDRVSNVYFPKLSYPELKKFFIENHIEESVGVVLIDFKHYTKPNYTTSDIPNDQVFKFTFRVFQYENESEKEIVQALNFQIENLGVL